MLPADGERIATDEGEAGSMAAIPSHRRAGDVAAASAITNVAPSRTDKLCTTMGWHSPSLRDSDHNRAVGLALAEPHASTNRSCERVSDQIGCALSTAASPMQSP